MKQLKKKVAVSKFSSMHSDTCLGSPGLMIVIESANFGHKLQWSLSERSIVKRTPRLLGEPTVHYGMFLAQTT